MKSDGYGLSDIFGFLKMSFWTIIGVSLGVPILICFATNDFCIVYYLIETLLSKILKVKLVSMELTHTGVIAFIFPHICDVCLFDFLI